MKLTPLDIRHKEFKRGMRGYQDVEVDEFLDQVADEYERVFKENIDLQERIEALEEKVAGYKRIEDTLQKTLITAQASAEELKQNASKEAKLVMGDAELKARQILNESYSKKQAIEEDISRMKTSEQDFRFKFRQMLQGYLQQLGESGERDQAQLARHAEAIKEAIAREETSSRAPAAAVEESEVTEEPPAPAAVEVEAAEAAPEAADQPEPAVAEQEAGSATEEQPAVEGARERILFGESDDLLADVDTGVNEHEFKW